MSFGAVITACSAAADRRPKATVIVCPLFRYVQPHKADKAYAMLIRVRLSQLHGNEHCLVAPFIPLSDNLIGIVDAGGLGGLKAYKLIEAAVDLNIPYFREQFMMQTCPNSAMLCPKEYMETIQAPVLRLIPDSDNIFPPTEQREAFARIKISKNEYLSKGKGYLNVIKGEGSNELIIGTLDFFQTMLDRALE